MPNSQTCVPRFVFFLQEKQALEETKNAEIESLKNDKQSLQDQIDQLTRRCEDRDRIYEDVLASKLQLEESVAKITAEKDDELAKKEKVSSFDLFFWRGALPLGLSRGGKCGPLYVYNC